MKNHKLFDDLKLAIESMELITELRNGPADHVTLMNDNDDPPPGVAIECCGEWTAYANRRFEGNTVLECLQAAVLAKRNWNQK